MADYTANKSLKDYELDKFVEDSNNQVAINTVAQVTDSSGNSININDSGQLKVVLDGKVCPNNTTTTPLAADAVFHGIGTDTLDYALIFISVYSSHDSASNGLCLQSSSDNMTWYDEECYSVPAATSKTYSFQPNRRYARVKYINGNTDQSTFDLETIFKKTNSKPSSHKIQDAIIDDDDATLQKAVLTGKNPAGNFVNFEATTSGNFKCSLEEFENQVSVNGNTQLKTTQYDSSGNELFTTTTPAEIRVTNVDSVTDAVKTINYEHKEVHSGSHYFIADYDTGLNMGATVEFIIVTPNTTKWTHMTYRLSSSLANSFHVLEGLSSYTGGTSVNPLNNNRNSSNTSSLTVIKDPTTTAGGTILYAQYSGANREAGIYERETELVLKQNTIYLFRITSQGANNIISYQAEWYEHTNLV